MHTETGIQLVPAGWYQDSPDPTQVRWWDGEEWTDHVQTLPPEVAHAADVESTLTRRQLREQNGSLFAGELDINAERDAAELAQQAQVARVAAERAAADVAAAAQAAQQATTPTPEQAAKAERERVEAVRIAAARFADEQVAAAAAAAAKASAGAPAFTPAVAKETYLGSRDIQNMQNPKESVATERARIWNSDVGGQPITLKKVGAQTFAVWLLAIMPLWATAAAWQLPLLELTEDKRLPYLVIGLFTVLFSFGLAQSDSAQLRERGFDKVPSAVWAIVPFLYLIIRAFKLGAGGTAPLLTFIALQVGVVLLAFNAAVPIVLAAIENAPVVETAEVVEPVRVPLTGEQRERLMTPEGAAEQLGRDLAAEGFVASTVDCQPFPSEEVGASAACAVTVDGVSTTVTLLLTPGDPFRAFVIEQPADTSSGSED